MKNPIENQQGQAGGSVVADEQQPERFVRIDYNLDEVIFLTRALTCVVAIPEITEHLYVEIDLGPNHGVRVWFSAADLPLGYVVIRPIGNGSIEIEADTVLQDLENRTKAGSNSPPSIPLHCGFGKSGRRSPTSSKSGLGEKSSTPRNLAQNASLEKRC